MRNSLITISAAYGSSRSSLTTGDTAVSKKKVIFIRHGRSFANEYMDQEGNRWGDSTFTDDLNYADSKLSDHGRHQARGLRKNLASGILPTNEGESLLIVLSPLTRAIETFNIAFHDLCDYWSNFTILAHPLATERVYTASDTGRSIAELMNEFPHVDFESEFRPQNRTCDEWRKRKWWFHKNETMHEEFRPHGNGQFYAVPGEPEHIFHSRMQRFSSWLSQREEQSIIVFTHWAVIKWFSGLEVENCDFVAVEI